MGEIVKHGRDLALLENDAGWVGRFSFAHHLRVFSPLFPQDPHPSPPITLETQVSTFPWPLSLTSVPALQETWGTLLALDSERLDRHIRPSPCLLGCVPTYTVADFVWARTHTCTRVSVYPSSGPERRPSLSATLFPSGILLRRWCLLCRVVVRTAETGVCKVISTDSGLVR